MTRKPAAPAARPIGGLALAAALALGLAGCEQTIQVRGNMPEASELDKINPGVHGRDDVARLLGSPSSVSTFQDSKWFYIGQKTTEFAFFAPEVLERKVVVVSFDEAGLVAEATTYDLDDGQDIDPVARVTPTEGKEMSFLQQIFGNIGRFPSKGRGAQE